MKNEQDKIGYQPSIHEYRSMWQEMIYQRQAEFSNKLDAELEELILKLELKNLEANNKYESLISMQYHQKEKFDNLANQLGISLEELEFKANDQAMYAMFKSEEIYVYSEIQIIYAFKHIEVQIRGLLKTAYQSDFNRSAFQWNNLVEFIRSKGIDIQSINGYQEINQLRRVNNALKHSEEIDIKEFADIKEFKNEINLTSDILRTFYQRIKKIPCKFITQLTDAVCEERFGFTNQRLEQLANHYAMRMDKKTAQIFARFLLEKYNLEK